MNYVNVQSKVKRNGTEKNLSTMYTTVTELHPIKKRKKERKEQNCYAVYSFFERVNYVQNKRIH